MVGQVLLAAARYVMLLDQALDLFVLQRRLLSMARARVAHTCIPPSSQLRSLIVDIHRETSRVHENAALMASIERLPPRVDDRPFP